MHRSGKARSDWAIKAWFKRVAGGLALVGCLIGFLGLLGFLTGETVLYQTMSWAPPMSFLSALAVLFLGLSLLAFYSSYTLAGLILTFPPLLIGVLGMIENSRGPFWPAPETCLSITFLGVSLLTCPPSGRRLSGLSFFSGLLGIGLPILILTGHLSKTVFLENPAFVEMLTGMSPNTAAALTLIAIANLLIRTESHWIKPLAENNIGGVAARRLVAAFFFVPLSIGILGYLLFQLHFLPSLWVALSLYLSVAVFLALTWKITRKVAQAERELHESREFLRSLVDLSPDAIILADLNEKLVQANQAASRLMGLDQKEIPGRTIQDILKPEDYARVKEAMAYQLSGKTQIAEWELKTKDGRLIPVESSAKILPDKRWLSIVRDISQRKMAEEELKKAEKMREEWISIIAHDLRQPITVIAAAADMLEHYDRELSDSEKDDIKTIHSSVLRLDRMIGDLLDASRIEASQLHIYPQNIDLKDLVQQKGEQFQRSVPDRVFELDLPKVECFPVWADPERLEQVLDNLLSNAVKYSLRGSPIKIKMCCHAEETLIQIVNRGVGLTPGELEKVFDRFQRGEKTRRMTTGTGLGLYIAKGLVVAHGGRIWAESVPGKETNFSFTLPTSKH